MRIATRRSAFALALFAALAVVAASGAGSAPARTLVTPQVSLVGTGTPQTGFVPSGDVVTNDEFAGVEDDEQGEEPESFDGTIVDRSLSKGSSNKLIGVNSS